MKESCDAVATEDGSELSPRHQLERVTEEFESLDATAKTLKSAIETAAKQINTLQDEISNHKVVTLLIDFQKKLCAKFRFLEIANLE